MNDEIVEVDVKDGVIKYNPEGAEQKVNPVEADEVYLGEIVKIEDGTVQTFIHENAKDKWEGKLSNPAINVIIETRINKQTITSKKMFTYLVEDGKTIYTKNSNLRKFKDKYQSLPLVGMEIKLLGNKEGYLDIIM